MKLQRLHVVFEPCPKLSPYLWMFERKLNDRFHVFELIPRIVELSTFNLGSQYLLPISNHELNRIIVVELASLFQVVMRFFKVIEDIRCKEKSTDICQTTRSIGFPGFFDDRLDIDNAIPKFLASCNSIPIVILILRYSDRRKDGRTILIVDINQ